MRFNVSKLKILTYSLIHIFSFIPLWSLLCFPMYLSSCNIPHMILTTPNVYCLALPTKMKAP